jgi:hypothetical protein
MNFRPGQYRFTCKFERFGHDTTKTGDRKAIKDMPADEPKKERHDDTFGAVVQS